MVQPVHKLYKPDSTVASMFRRPRTNRVNDDNLLSTVQTDKPSGSRLRATPTNRQCPVRPHIPCAIVTQNNTTNYNKMPFDHIETSKNIHYFTISRSCGATHSVLIQNPEGLISDITVLTTSDTCTTYENIQTRI